MKHWYKILPVIAILLTVGGFALYTEASSVGPVGPGTAADDAAVGVNAWSNPNNAKLNDATYATAVSTGSGTQISHYLDLTNFGFSIPTNMQILGVEVDVERFNSGGCAATVTDSGIFLINGGIVSTGTNMASATTWPTGGEAFAAYGGPSNLWGLTLTPAIVNASNFGVSLSASVGFKSATPCSATASVDYVQMTVTYILPTFHSKVTIQPGSVSNITPTTQQFTASSLWLTPPGVTSVVVKAWGGGGSGGGGGVTSSGGGGGGGGGAYAQSTLTVVPGSTYIVTVGTGGASAAVTVVGNAGGDSWFNTTAILLAKGGSGGGAGAAGAGGAGGTTAASVGTTKNAGGTGGVGTLNGSGGGGGSGGDTTAGGIGGASSLGSNGNGGTAGTTNGATGGKNAIGNAPGGAGAGAGAGASKAGANGEVDLTYTIPVLTPGAKVTITKGIMLIQ